MLRKTLIVSIAGALLTLAFALAFSHAVPLWVPVVVGFPAIALVVGWAVAFVVAVVMLGYS